MTADRLRAAARLMRERAAGSEWRLAVADWLESWADHVEVWDYDVDHEKRPACDAAAPGDLRCDVAALAVADAYLGVGSTHAEHVARLASCPEPFAEHVWHWPSLRGEHPHRWCSNCGAVQRMTTDSRPIPGA